MVLTTESTVVDKPEEKQPAGGHGHGHGHGHAH
jgi:chaperonin GroEL